MILDWYISSTYPDPAAYLGPLPGYISGASSDQIWQQLSDNSISGWHPEPPGDWQLSADDELLFPGLPPLQPTAYAYHLGEKILAYPAGFVCIVQLSSAFTVARIS